MPVMTNAQHADAEHEDGHSSSLLSDILAIIGLVILGVIIIWGLVHLVSLSSNWFSSLFPSSGASIQITAPAEVVSGDATTISWNYSPSEKGSYAFLYQCESGFRFDFTPTSGVNVPIICGSGFSVPSTGDSIVVTPALSTTMTKPLSVPFSIVFIPVATTSKQVVGTAKITIDPATSTAPTKTTSAPAPYTKPANTSRYTSGGTPDLSVHIITSGVIDPATGALIARQPTSPSDVSAVEFDIANTGSAPTGTWYFEAYLPTPSGYTYISPAQVSLAPGSHIVNILRFNQVAPGGGVFSVTVDPNGLVRDANRGNNYASVAVSSPVYYPAQVQQPYYAQPPVYQY